MQRRLAIAQAIVHNPAVVLLDEPTVGLDPIQRISVRTMLTGIATQRAVMVSTHLVEDVRGFHARVLALTNGQLVFDGSVEDLESRADPTAPGDSPLEQALAALMAEDPVVAVNPQVPGPALTEQAP
jgi:ABC-2 type transport system ATP-binding protein